VRQREHHVARGMWGLAPTGGRRPGRPWPGRGACLFWQWHADEADAQAPAIGGRGSEKREAWAHMGRPEETRSGPSLKKQ
jgi:hypothetical protein